MKIRKAKWKFDEEITKKIRVRGWFSDYDADAPEYKYNSVRHLVETVDKFIKKNKIKTIISYKNTAKTVEVDEGWDMVYDKRIGGITLVYKKPKKKTNHKKAKNKVDYH